MEVRNYNDIKTVRNTIKSEFVYYMFDKNMKPIAAIENVFETFGRAAYYAQLMEYDIVSIWMVDSVAQGLSLTSQDLLRFQEDWGKKTFGQLLKPLQKSNLIPKEIKGFLQQLRVTRNRLMHSFFLDTATDLQSNTGRERIVAELQHAIELFKKWEQFFGDILNTYLKDFGVDAEVIRRQVLQKFDDAEQDDPANGNQPIRSETN
jgi:hypothetical protein